MGYWHLKGGACSGDALTPSGDAGKIKCWQFLFTPSGSVNAPGPIWSKGYCMKCLKPNQSPGPDRSNCLIRLTAALQGLLHHVKVRHSELLHPSVPTAPCLICKLLFYFRWEKILLKLGILYVSESTEHMVLCTQPYFQGKASLSCFDTTPFLGPWMPRTRELQHPLQDLFGAVP